jgi:hypothetical protein
MVTRKMGFYEQISDLYLWENTLLYDKKNEVCPFEPLPPTLRLEVGDFSVNMLN